MASRDDIFVKLLVGFYRNPKVRALARYGSDAGLARDLYVAMLLYCKEYLSDGFVPKVEVGALAYPLPIDHAEQLAKQLASVELTNEECKDGVECWFLPGFLQRNRSKTEVQRISALRAEAGREGGLGSKKPAGETPPKAKPKQVAKQPRSKKPPQRTENSSSDTPNGASLLPPPAPPRSRPLWPAAVSDPTGQEGEGARDGPAEAEVTGLVAEAKALRPEWAPSDIRAAALDPYCLERAWPYVREAALICWADKGTQSPGRLAQNGGWWAQAAQRLNAGEWDCPPRDLRCPVHLLDYVPGTECRACAADRKGVA